MKCKSTKFRRWCVQSSASITIIQFQECSHWLQKRVSILSGLPSSFIPPRTTQPSVRGAACPVFFPVGVVTPVACMSDFSQLCRDVKAAQLGSGGREQDLPFVGRSCPIPGAGSSRSRAAAAHVGQKSSSLTGATSSDFLKIGLGFQKQKEVLKELKT